MDGYSEILDEHSSIDISKLRTDQKVAYLHNAAAIEALKTRRIDTSKAKHFIQNIALPKEKSLFAHYLDIYDGNTKNVLQCRLHWKNWKKM